MSDAIDEIRALIAPQWRSIPNDLSDIPIEAFRAGRNWMIDRIREALDPRKPGYAAIGDARKRLAETGEGQCVDLSDDKYDEPLADWERELLEDMPAIQQPLGGLLSEIRVLMLDRHQKYGSGNISEFGDTGLLVRMGDKFARLRNGYQDFDDESLEDTLKDIVGYSLIWLMWNRGQWPGQEKS